MRYHDITKDDMKNGDGLRVVLWLSGCAHACPGCQNPITWDPEDGLIYDGDAEKEITDQLSQIYNSGLTLSGGDPLFSGNRQEVTELCKRLKGMFPTKTIWLYTGYLWEEIKDLPVLDYVDVVVDGPYVEGQRDTTLLWKGSKNQRVISVRESLDKGEIILHCGDYKEKPKAII